MVWCHMIPIISYRINMHTRVCKIFHAYKWDSIRAILARMSNHNHVKDDAEFC